MHDGFLMDVILPKLGEGAEGGTVVSLLVSEGDTVTEGQTILELENEKAVAPIPSTVTGRVTQIRVKEGDRIAVGQVLLTVAESSAALPPSGPAQAAPKVPTPGRMPAEPQEATKSVQVLDTE